MTREKLLDILRQFAEESPTNYLQPKISDEDAEAQMNAEDTNNFQKNNYFGGGKFDPRIYNKDKEDKYIGMRFFNAPIIAVGAADDPGYEMLRTPGIVGPHHKVPGDWVPGAKTVISVFFPYSDTVLRSNERDPQQPSLEWMFTRVDGQNHLLASGAAVVEALKAEGYQAVAPQTDPRFALQTHYRVMGEDTPFYTSNWSERHVGYVAGLGTFGLNTSLITNGGCAGRLMSIVTDWECAPDEKDYSDYLDYCSRCGACQKACPGGAIGENCTKDHDLCSQYVGKVSAAYRPRYGCGKCQAALPCSRRRMK